MAGKTRFVDARPVTGFAYLMVGLSFLAAVPANAAVTARNDPAMRFVSDLMLGQDELAAKIIAGPVSQAERQQVIEGKTTVSVKEFFDAVSSCPLSGFRNTRLDGLPGSRGRPRDVFVTWDCGTHALGARVRSIGSKVEISTFERLIYIAPPPPPPTSKASH